MTITLHKTAAAIGIGILVGIGMSLDPLLPALKIPLPPWIFTLSTPIITVTRAVLLFGPAAALVSSWYGYRTAKQTARLQSGITATGLPLLAILISNCVFLSVVLMLLLQFPGLRQLAIARMGSSYTAVEADYLFGAYGEHVAPDFILVWGLAICVIVISNLVIGAVCGGISSWIGMQRLKG